MNGNSPTQFLTNLKKRLKFPVVVWSKTRGGKQIMFVNIVNNIQIMKIWIFHNEEILNVSSKASIQSCEGALSGSILHCAEGEF